MSEIERKAREILAAEYVKCGQHTAAALVRSGRHGELAVRAIITALSLQEQPK